MPKKTKALKGFNLMAGGKKVPLQLKTMTPAEYVEAKKPPKSPVKGTSDEPKQ